MSKIDDYFNTKGVKTTTKANSVDSYFANIKKPNLKLQEAQQQAAEAKLASDKANSFGGLLKETLKGVGGTLYNAVGSILVPTATPEELRNKNIMGNTLLGLPKAVYQTAKQVVTHPIQTAQSIVGGATRGISDELTGIITNLFVPKQYQEATSVEIKNIFDKYLGATPENNISQGYNVAGHAAPYILAGGVLGDVGGDLGAKTLGNSKLTPTAINSARRMSQIGSVVGNTAGFVGVGQASIPTDATLKQRAERATQDLVALGLFTAGSLAFKSAQTHIYNGFKAKAVIDAKTIPVKSETPNETKIPIKVDRKLLNEPVKQGQIEAPKKNTVIQGKDFTMTEKPNKIKVEINKLQQDYNKKLELFNKKPTTLNKDNALKAREIWIEKSKSLPIKTKEQVKPSEVNQAGVPSNKIVEPNLPKSGLETNLSPSFTRTLEPSGASKSTIIKSKEISQKTITPPKPIETKTDTQLKSRVFERMKAENPSLEGDLGYDPIKQKADFEKAVNLIAKDKQKAYDIAMGKETSTEVTSTATNITLAEKALQEGNNALYAKLIKNRSLEQTRRGQEISAERGSVSDNSTARYVKELISNRLEILGKRYLGDLVDRKTTGKGRATKVIDNEVAKMEAKIKSKKLNVKDALSLLEKLTCI